LKIFLNPHHVFINYSSFFNFSSWLNHINIIFIQFNLKLKLKKKNNNEVLDSTWSCALNFFFFFFNLYFNNWPHFIKISFYTNCLMNSICPKYADEYNSYNKDVCCSVQCNQSWHKDVYCTIQPHKFLQADCQKHLLAQHIMTWI